MSEFTIPNQYGQIRQASRGDVFGELVHTFNIDLNSSLGKIKTAKKMVKVLDEDTNLSGEVPQAFEIYDPRYWMITSDGLFHCSLNNDPTDSANWTNASGIKPAGLGFYSDMVVFNGLLLMSLNTNIASYNGSSTTANWWTSTVSGSSLTTGYPHIMHVHRGGQETLFVTDKNRIRYMNLPGGTPNHFTVTLQTDLVACCVTSGVDRVWVGTYTESGGNAYVYEIVVGETLDVTDSNGAVLDTTPVARNAYKVEGRAVLSIEVVDNVPYIITEKGNLQAFNGAGFTTVASFPFSYTQEELSDVRAGLVQDSNTSRPVHPKGMRQHNQSIFININTELYSGDYANKAPSGIWEYNKETNTLNHRYALADSTSVYGEYEGRRSGPLLIVDNEHTFLMAGGESYTGPSGVFVESASANQGFFVTSEIQSQSVADAFESLYLKAKTLGDGESIVLKYRTTKKDRQFCNGTFIDTLSFNTTDTVNVEVGNEVTITRGTNAGKIAHIASITTSSSVTSITLDTALGTANETQRFEINNFKLAGGTYTSEDGEYKRFGDFGTNPWIQYKVVMTGDVELRQLLRKTNNKSSV